MSIRLSILSAIAMVILMTTAMAAPVTLRIQTHYAQENPTGQQLAQWAEDVNVMSGGDITIEMFYASSVVPSVETFDAAISGVLDCDATGGGYQVGKDPAFQFVNDLMGGYNTPWEQYAWFYYGGGIDAAQALYEEYNMIMVGPSVYGQESLASSRRIAGPEDLKGWKFRSPPGMETEIFEGLGASPIVMDFTEIFTALETGIIDGADASGIANNVGLGLYEIVNHTNYPGFHSMPSDHLACNLDVWNGLTDQQRRIMEVSWQKAAFQVALYNANQNEEAVTELREKGVNIYDWSADDRSTFRNAAQAAWEVWGDKNERARALLESHKSYLRKLGLIE